MLTAKRLRESKAKGRLPVAAVNPLRPPRDAVDVFRENERLERELHRFREMFVKMEKRAIAAETKLETTNKELLKARQELARQVAELPPLKPPSLQHHHHKKKR